MDSERFDRLVRSFGQTRSRRQTLRGLAGVGALVALLAATPVAADKTGQPNKAPKKPGGSQPGNSPPGSGQNGGGGLGAVGPSQDCEEQCREQCDQSSHFRLCMEQCEEQCREPCEEQCEEQCFQACEGV